MKKLTIVIEKNKDGYWVRAEGDRKYVPNGYGDTKKAAIKNLKEVLKDHLSNEGKNDKIWNKVDIDTLEEQYNLQSFFEEHNYLNISAIAERADMNSSLLRQYAIGVKYPSLDQAKKIENTIHRLANELQSVTIFA